jgi:hypothetical protein
MAASGFATCGLIGLGAPADAAALRRYIRAAGER